MSGQYLVSAGNTTTFADDIGARLRKLSGTVVPRMVLSGDVLPEHMALLTTVLKTTTYVVIKHGSSPRTLDVVKNALAAKECVIARISFPPLTPREESEFMPVLYYNKSLRDVTVRDPHMLYACATNCRKAERLSFFCTAAECAMIEEHWDLILQMPSLRTVEFRPTGAVPLAMFCIAWPGCTLSVGQWGRIQISRAAPSPAA